MATIQTLNLPPLPPLKRESYFWDGEIKLATWAGFITRVDNYHKRSASDGTVSLHIDPLKTPPSKEQIATFQFLLENEKAVYENILRAVLEIYPAERAVFREAYGYSSDMDEEEKEDFEEEYGYDVPAVTDPEQLKEIIRLQIIHISSAAKDGFAYMGFEFDCNWDEEHGLGVLMHKDRILRVAQAEVSFGSANEDGVVDLELIYGIAERISDEPVGALVDDPDPVENARLEECMKRLRGLA